MPIISIIVPIYNVDKFLSKCIESILSQSYHEFELLLINDGSIDKSAHICDEYSLKDKRIKVIHQSNKGVTAARKIGWQKSQGKWIVFVDADDIAHFNCLDILLTQAVNNCCDIVNASFQSIPSGRIWIHKKLGLLSREEYLESFLNNQTYGVVYASIYKKSIFQDSTFAFDSSLKIGEDVLTNIELALRANKILNLSEIIYDYRENLESVMNQKVLHPSYLERYYNTTAEIFRRINNVDESYFVKLNKEKYKAQIDAFFSPHISFDDYYYEILNKTQQILVNSENLNGRKTILSLAIKNKPLAKIVKAVLYFAFIGKKLLKREKIVKKQVIY